MTNEVPELIIILDNEGSHEVIDNISDDEEKTKPVSNPKSIVFPKKITRKKLESWTRHRKEKTLRAIRLEKDVLLQEQIVF